MPTEHKITTYRFDELSDDAKTRARQWYRDGLQFDHEYTLDEAKRLLSLIGFSDAEIYYSGFWSQGDGACFTSGVDMSVLFDVILGRNQCDKWLDDWKWLVGDIYPASYFDRHSVEWFDAFEIQNEICASVVRSGPSNFYSHEYTASLEWSMYGVRDATETRLDEFFAGLEELRRDLCQAIYSSLQREYDYQNSDEVIDESLVINEYEFYADGRVF